VNRAYMLCYYSTVYGRWRTRLIGAVITVP
jgi:hypothetical protein